MNTVSSETSVSLIFFTVSETCFSKKYSAPVVYASSSAIYGNLPLGHDEINKFSILSPLHSNSFSFNKRIFSMGLEKKYCSTRGIGMSVLDLAKDRKKTLNKILSIGKAAINKDGADVLILGCMSMAFHDIAPVIQKKLKVPVINPVKASLLTAEALVKMNIFHSKITYPKPLSKKIY